MTGFREKDYSFFTQASVVDAVRDQAEPASDVVDVIIEALLSREDLRKYFFKDLTNPIWAVQFHSRGLFVSPDPEKKRLRPYLLDYLSGVAGRVPDVVKDVAGSICPNGYYELYAILAAVRGLAPESLRQIVEHNLPAWIREESEVAHSATADVLEFLISVAPVIGPHSILPALAAILEPVSMNGTTACGRGELYWIDEKRRDLIPLLAQPWHEATTLLESLLVRSMAMEAEGTGHAGRATWGFWRQAVEDTDQDRIPELKDSLLLMLRDLLEQYFSNESEAVKGQFIPWLDAKLGGDNVILRRLAIHVIRLFPEHCDHQLRSLLSDSHLYEDSEIQYEFFRLLEDTFPRAQPDIRAKVLETICTGPSQARIDSICPLYAEHANVSLQDAVSTYINLWTRDRLWMIRKHLDPLTAGILESLTSQYGKPDHPEFTSRITSGFVGQSSPFPKEDLLRAEPRVVIRKIAEWTPERGRTFDAPSPEGLAQVFREVVRARVADYAMVAEDLADAALDPGYIRSFLEGLRDAAKAGEALPWSPILDLCERLVDKRETEPSGMAEHTNYWLDASTALKAVVELLDIGLDSISSSGANFHRTLGILTVLAGNSDPDEKADNPPPGTYGHLNPAAVALNHVRPMAVHAIIGWCQTEKQATGNGLHPGVQRLLEAKLLPDNEPSLAVRSVFGRLFPVLVYLDQEWAWAKMDAIFPDHDKVRFGAAFSSLVSFNPLYTDLYTGLRRKYVTALRLCNEGDLVPGLGGDTMQTVAGHIVLSYIVGNEDVTNGQLDSSVIADIYQFMPASAIAGAMWFVWRSLESNETFLSDDHWTRARMLMTWRLGILEAQGSPSTADDEVKWLAHWVSSQPSESPVSAFSLLKAMLPHLARSGHGRHTVEEYFSAHVGQFPQAVASLYRGLHEQTPQGAYIHPGKVTRSILETAAAFGGSARSDALATVDWLARRGYFGFRDIYDAHSRSSDA